MATTYLKPVEAAAEMRVAPKTVYRWLRAGKLRGERAGRAWRIREEDMRRFMRWQEEGPPVQPSRADEQAGPLGGREFSDDDIQAFLEADKLDEETAQKVARLLSRR
jgi:excisionase family DNA binding protein